MEEGDYDVEVPVFDATEIGYAAAGFNRMVAGLRERERLEERRAAALFVDIVGSTRVLVSAG